MVKDHKFTMMIDKKEKDRLTVWAKEQGYNSLAKLIRESLDIVHKNPILLQPTESDIPIRLYKDLRKDFEKWTHEIEQRFEKRFERMGSELGMTKRQIKNTKVITDFSHDAVLE